MTGSPGRVVSVNVGVPRPVSWRGRIVHTAIFKYPVDGRVPVLGRGRDHARAPEILAAPELAEFWRSWAQGLLDSRKLRRPGARLDRREHGDAS